MSSIVVHLVWATDSLTVEAWLFRLFSHPICPYTDHASCLKTLMYTEQSSHKREILAPFLVKGEFLQPWLSISWRVSCLADQGSMKVHILRWRIGSSLEGYRPFMMCNFCSSLAVNAIARHLILAYRAMGNLETAREGSANCKRLKTCSV